MESGETRVMIGTIAVILVFGGLIFFHELGHFFVARLFGMGVKTFSLGFGPAVFSFKRKKTVYQVAAVPLGGFVSLVGESADAEIPEPFTPEESFSLRPAWQRFPVIAAGSVFNLLLAWFICWGLVWVNGRTEMTPVVGEILEGSAAAASPMRAGDRILSLNGKDIRLWTEMPPIVQENQGKPMVVAVVRPDGSTLTFSIAPTLLKQTLPDGGKIENWGMGIRQSRHQYGFFQSALEGMAEARDMVTFTWNALADLISRKVSFDNVGGPILIAQAIYKQADYGLVSVFMIAALISVNLGVLNLLPIPVLDGGHLIFLLVEMLIRRPVPPAVQEKAAFVGLFMLIALMIAATFNDVMRFFS